MHGNGAAPLDGQISAGYTFNLHRTQNWGIGDFEYGGSGSNHFVIPVGQFYTGNMNYLFFVMDHDVSSPTGTSYFSSIKVYEQNHDNYAPVVALNSPASGATFTEGDSIQFGATATDTEDGDLSASITWSSSLEEDTGGSGPENIDTV